MDEGFRRGHGFNLMPICGRARRNDGLFISFSPMTHAADTDYPYGVGNLINYPVIPYPNSPVIVTTNQFPATRRTWIFLLMLRSIH